MSSSTDVTEYDRFFTLSLDMLCIADFNGYFKQLNPAWEKTLGFTIEELKGKGFLEFVHPDDQEATIAIAQKLTTEGGSTVSFENRYLCKDGSYKWLSWNSTVSLEKQLYYAVARDITERKQAEDAQREIAERFRQLAENIREVFWLTSPDKNQIFYISPGYEELWGRTCESLYQQPRSFLDAIHPDDRERVIAAQPKQIRGEYDEEYRIVRPDGSVRWVRSRAFPIRNEFGEVYRIAGLSDDITRHKQAELALVAARELAESIVTTIQEALVVLDADDRVISANRVFYRVFRLTEEETLGQVFFELHQRQWDIPVLRQLLTEVLPQQRKVDAFELQHKFPGIGSRTVLISARLIEGASNRSALTVLTLLNITGRKRLEAEQARMIHELESVNEELTNFAYVVSHDLKAPLRAIGSLADWIAADQQDRLDAEGQEHLRLLIQRVRRMDALIDGVLRYSRIGRIGEAAVEVDLNEVLHEVIDSLAPPAHIAVRVASRLPSIRAEKTSIQQVLQNLIANAIRYLDKPQGRIEIGCADQGASWRFSVADNGPGIEARHFQRIFQLFQTLNPRDRVESTGVGLAIVKKIVEQYGGQVWVESALGQGSTFFFTLPKTINKTPKGEAK